MKTLVPWTNWVAFAFSTLLLPGWVAARVDNQEDGSALVTSQAQSGFDYLPAPDALAGQSRILVQSVEPYSRRMQSKELAWLGLAFEESSEALSSQLGLKPGEGLTVNFVAPDSPAAKAAFHTNDVLVELDGQMLVHPLQLRKLIQMHAEGDTIKLAFYRGGTRQTSSVKLGKNNLELASDKEEGSWPGYLKAFQFQHIPRLNADGSMDAIFNAASGKKEHARESTWLGLSCDESSQDEALSSQLGLKPGEGLTVNFVAPDSPAAKAAVHTNDVLVELDGQMLVHPMQLRKLIQMHADRDTIRLSFYRDGKKQTCSVKVAKAPLEQASENENRSRPGDLQNLQFQLNGLNGQLGGVSDSLARVGLDRKKVDIEIQHTMEQTRKAIEDAVRRSTNDHKDLASVNRDLEALARDGVGVSKDATVIIRNKHNAKRTIVQTDENGTLIIQEGAKSHLTARDKDGRLLFDGDVDTPADQEKVPQEVWEKAKPLFERTSAPAGSKPKTEDPAEESPKS